MFPVDRRTTRESLGHPTSSGAVDAIDGVNIIATWANRNTRKSAKQVGWYMTKCGIPAATVSFMAADVRENMQRGDSFGKTLVRAVLTTTAGAAGAAWTASKCTAFGPTPQAVGCGAILAPLGAYAGEKAGARIADRWLGPRRRG